MLENAVLVPETQMARIVGVPVDWLREEAEAGRVPSLRAGDRFIFHPPAVEKNLIDRASTKSHRPLISRKRGRRG